jgi:PIN domain nuclease of toxin-antitoxin system
MELALLLDTHIVVWMATAPHKIPKRLLAAIEIAPTRFVSHVTAIEIQFKYSKNAEVFPFSLDHLEQTMKEFSCTELPLSFGDIKTVGQMTTLHRDPFDRLLMAQASNRNIHLATLDRDILRCSRKYKGFKVLARKATSS